MVPCPFDTQERSNKRLAAEAPWMKRNEEFMHQDEVAGMVSFLQDVDFDY